MDELLHHCLRELSFDGDLGCDVSRLRDFIVEFYTHSRTPQTPDDAFCAFVWSLVVQRPAVRVGTIPAGVTFDVWIAPQISAKRKAREKGEEHIETKPTELDLVPDAKNRSLEDLKQEYGDKLRIALDSDAIYAAITGSHIRFPKLSPMVYSALQIITRGRDNGVTVVELGQQSKYDQKTCFYLVRQLTELDLVVKVRRGGVGTHFCIHKYFFDRSPSWRAIREEELRADDANKSSREPAIELPNDEEDRVTDLKSMEFTPIDARHLSSLPLIRARVVKLLNASRNHMHAANNMLITLGFSNPSKTDRRFFQSRIRELIQQGVIEKVVVPSNRKKSLNASVKCFRLVSKDRPREDLDDDAVVAQPVDGDDDEKDISEQSGIRMNITIHRQIIDLLEDAGMAGMTLNELSAALCRFDKRTIELLLARAEKFPPSSHLSDLGIVGLMETSGRERRHRYYTVASYRKLVIKENLDNSTAGYADVDFTNVGGFLEVDPNLFYSDQNALSKYQDDFQDKAKTKNAKPRKHLLTNPILPDGTVKQGRPRKYPVGEDSRTRRKANKRKRDQEVADDGNISEAEQTQLTKKRRLGGGDVEVKKRGRPPKPKPENGEKVVKKRGRPPKVKSDLSQKRSRASGEEEQETVELRKRGRSVPTEDNSEEGVPKKRGRLDKGQSANDDVEITLPIGEEAAAMESPLSDIPSSTDFRIETPNTTEPFPSQKTGTEVDHVSSAQQQSSLEHGVHSLLPEVISARMPMGKRQEEHPVTVSSDSSTLSASPTHRGFVEGIGIISSCSHHRRTDLEDAQTGFLSTSFGSSIAPLVDLSARSKPPEREPTSAPPNAKHTEAVHESKKLGFPKLNVSHLRRENELYRVVEIMGGIVNIQTKEFFEEHMALLESMAKAGEATSAPVGTRTDKRTAATTFNNMEMRGRIKQLKTAIMTHTGVRRPASIVYLPTIEQEKLNAFFADLARGIQPSPQQGTVLKLDERVEYGADPTSIARGALPLQLLQMEEPGIDRKERWSKNVARADQLFSYDDNIIREVLLTERTTLGQLYGFIVGKVVRARELHLSALGAFDTGNPSSNIISQDRRILDVSFFVHDIPLGLYCSLVSSLSHDEDLTRFLTTDQGRQTLARDIPSNLNFLLQIGRSRARSRFLDILEMLRALKLVTPLQPSTSGTPWITCEPMANRPNAFNLASLDGWTVSTPMAAPVYWHFNDVASLHVWAASEVTPPFWQDVPVACRADGLTYWRLLKEACTNTAIITPSNSVSIMGPPSEEMSVARSLRRSISWNADYILTWHQMQYMKRFTDPSTTYTPLQDEDSGEGQIQKISWVISAPQQTVRTFFEKIHEKLSEELQKARRKADRQTTEKRAKRPAAAKASLAKKAAAARNQREEEWESILLRLHPIPLEDAASIRVRRVRARFLQAGSTKDIQKWESEITEALHEADTASKRVLKVADKRTFVSRTAPVSVPAPPAAVANPPEKSIQALIAQQGPALIQKDDVKRKRKSKDVEESPEIKPKALRRHRFQWNRDYEELARDASAIIKARCRSLPRLDWAAFEQVFPAVPRNTVRQRLAHIREIPGNETYLNRLEDRWYELWMQHRGTTVLPDDDPQSPSNFNLIKHIEFLRQHVDKNALRVGFSQPKEIAGTILPASLDQLLDQYDVVETAPTVPTWDFVWNAVVEEGREKRMLRQPFNKSVEDMLFTGEGQSEAISLAEAGLKMALGTPNERYDPESASTLLHNVGEQYVSPAARNLLNRGVLSKLVRDPQKQKPGRQLKISEVNQNAIGGSIPRDTFQDAVALEDISMQDDTWREWPLLATDGDLAALIQLVSENKVEFNVDTSHAQLARPTLDWNSKKADDDQIETVIHIRTERSSETPLATRSVDSSPVTPFVELANEVSPEHGSTDGSVACCRRMSGNASVDCATCLGEEWTSIKESLHPQEIEVATQILTMVQDAKEHGVTKSRLRGLSNGQHLSVVKKLTESSVPLLFWAGYSTLVLVSSAYLKNWSVLVSESPPIRHFPRRWLDISGLKIVDFWETALRAVLGVIIFRPGISQAELRWRLRSVYDRQEVNDLLRFLENEGFMKMRCEHLIDRDVGPLDEREEKGVFWFIGEKRWYQV